MVNKTVELNMCNDMYQNLQEIELQNSVGICL